MRDGCRSVFICNIISECKVQVWHYLIRWWHSVYTTMIYASTQTHLFDNQYTKYARLILCQLLLYMSLLMCIFDKHKTKKLNVILEWLSKHKYVHLRNMWVILLYISKWPGKAKVQLRNIAPRFVLLNYYYERTICVNKFGYDYWFARNLTTRTGEGRRVMHHQSC